MLSPPKASDSVASRTLIESFTLQGKLPPLARATVEDTLLPLAAELHRASKERPDNPYVVAISGPPGTGKSTVCRALSVLLEEQFRLRTAILSTDDIYLPKASRQSLAQQIHPLLAVRGVPGTHDVPLGLATISSLMTAEEHTKTRLPRFDKLSDDRVPVAGWPVMVGRPHLIFLDSWFWRPQVAQKAEILTPQNERERLEDPSCVFRAYVEEALTDEYPPLFELAEYWVHLLPPDFETTVSFRVQQELEALGRGGSAQQDPNAEQVEPRIRSFLQLFERLVMRPLAEAPDRVLRVFADRSVEPW